MRRWLVLLSTLIAVAALAAPAPPLPALKTTEFGSGPTIVLIHPVGSARLAWMPVARKLLSNHRVVMVDLPGHGESPLPDPFSFQVAAEEVAQTLAAQKADSTIVVGQGIGGLLALMAASAHPDRANGVVLIDSSLRLESPVPDQMQAQYLQYIDQHYDDVLKMTYTRLGRDSTQGVTLHAQAARVPPATMKAYIRETLRADGNKALKALKQPLLFVGTEKRWPADKDWAATAKQLGFDDAGGIASLRLGNCGQMIASEQPDSLAAVLDQFEKQVLAKK